MGETVPVPEDWRDSEAVEAWLRTQPREVCVALAARAALRVLPLVGQVLDSEAARRAAIVVQSFRATAAAWLAAVGPTQAAELHDANVAANAARAAFDGNVRAAASFAANVRLAASFAVDAAAGATFAAGAAVADAGAFANAADAAAAFAADAAAVIDAYAADAALVLRGGDARALATAPLWPDGPPDWATAAWSALRTHLLADGEGWGVWIPWYEARLEGGPVDVELETRRVIDPKRWDEGPAAVNPEIAAIIADHEAKRRAQLVDVEALLSAPSIRIAIAEFDFDGIAKLMRLVQFPGDVLASDDPAIAKAIESDLAALALDARDLIEDTDPARVQAPQELRRDLSRYREATDGGLARFLPRRLWSLGASLQRWRLDEDTRHALGPHRTGRLDDLCEGHLDLMRTYFAGALARLRDVDKVRLADGVTAETLAAPLRKVQAALDGSEWAGAPNMTEEGRAVLASQLDELDAEIKAIGRARDPALKAELEESARKKAKVAVGTVGRFTLRAADTALRVAGGAATFKELFPETFADGISRLKELVPDLPTLW